jgi:hypothetical protein
MDPITPGIYLTRGGQIAIVQYERQNADNYPFAGIFDGDDDASWTRDGRWFIERDESMDDEADLVERLTPNKNLIPELRAELASIESYLADEGLGGGADRLRTVREKLSQLDIALTKVFTAITGP